MENVGQPFLKAVHAPLTEPQNTQVHLRAIAVDVLRQLCHKAVRRRPCLRVASVVPAKSRKQPQPHKKWAGTCSKGSKLFTSTKNYILCQNPMTSKSIAHVSGWFLKTCVLFSLNPCEQDILQEGFLISSQIPHPQSFSTTGAKCSKYRLQKLRKSSKTLANTPLGHYGVSLRPMRNSGALRSPKVPTKTRQKNDQSELWMPVISTSLTVRASLEKRARLKTYHLRQFRLLFSDLDFIEKAFLES